MVWNGDLGPVDNKFTADNAVIVARRAAATPFQFQVQMLTGRWINSLFPLHSLFSSLNYRHRVFPMSGSARRGLEKTAFYETHLLFANQMVNGPEEVFVRGTQRTVVRIASPQSQGCAST